MFKVKIPTIRQNEQRYALDILLGEFLGLAFEVESYDGDAIEITRPGDSNESAKLTLDASFFHKAHQAWLNPESVPVLPLANWTPAEGGIDANLVEPSVPVLYGQLGLVKNGEFLHLNLDIFGSAFFMLSRYEELITKDRDNHDRFPATASVAYQAGFLERPLVDEYLEILWQCLIQLWPDLERKQHASQTFVSCDVDQPYDCTVETLTRLLKTCAGDLLKRKNALEMLKRINRYVFNKLDKYKFDRNYSFDWYMDVCEKAGLKAAFYFIPTSKESQNGCYEITDNKVIKLMQKIDARGHEIGVHGSYQTYQDKAKMAHQKMLVEKALNQAGINQKIKGNRQHYLRWDSAVTPDYLDSAGFEYDTTGSYADRPGFRFGTSKEFSMWGWQSQTQLKLKQRPLVVMECSVISDAYMGLSYGKEAEELMMRLKQASQARGGNFALLWHNSHFQNMGDRTMFEKMVLH
ncbi:MAG: polysaccharide deacetylase family protein [Hydrogenovibrio sp.]|uniref:polysaccharide deacetylase family protein n=1 Tax=Hydrogenovibrio sp. TaxID=2065821 RepID=UPI00287074FF|nr:polysaccharide deacetylase family protein [Hydrogenovibrio sp.]MDR9498524.1 polysaccharide deacetylase family protein [Hydrogenovibrio sp.]MDR9499246.1 polysaccharide deacetylase family protein [Hydrogenovibrio sp.]